MVKPTCVRVVKAMMLVLLLLPRRVVATTVSDELAYGSYSYCYDPAGVSCTCTGEMYLWTGYGDDSYGDDSYGASSYGLSGRIPAELSACIGLTVLCVGGAMGLRRDGGGHTRDAAAPSKTTRRTRPLISLSSVLSHRDVEGSLLTGTLPAEFSALTGLTKLCVGGAMGLRRDGGGRTRDAAAPSKTTRRTRSLISLSSVLSHRHLSQKKSVTGTLPAEWSALTTLKTLCATRHALCSSRARSVDGAGDWDWGVGSVVVPRSGGYDGAVAAARAMQPRLRPRGAAR